jgi:SAM-dependent methyltransferase
VSELPDWSLSPDLVAFYESGRNTPEDLYPSERRFLPWLAGQAASVLDVGCAAGGFLPIWKAFAPEVRYEGVDVSPALVDVARRLHPEATFHQGDVLAGLPLPDGAADVVQALGWLHWVEDWERALAELWRLAGCRLFFDLRIAADGETGAVGRQRLELAGESDGGLHVPYIVVPWQRCARALAKLSPARIYGFGYLGQPADSATGIPERVCFATFVLERGVDTPLGVCLDLPLAWPLDVGRVLARDELPGG